MKHIRRKLVLYCYLSLGVFIIELFYPSLAYALTGGPSQPEVQSFEPIGTSDMVDLFSGDFKYNIPLMEVDGYPVNISYKAGINSDQEASWVGLGWNLNVGTIEREMRGIPDDFKGDKVSKFINMQDNKTIGLSASLGAEIIGKKLKKFLKGANLKLSANSKIGILHNNYNGLTFDLGMGINGSLSMLGGSKLSSGLNAGFTGASGLTLSPNLSFSNRVEEAENGAEKGTSLNASSSMNSRTGMKALNFGWGLYTTRAKKRKTGNVDPQVLSKSGGGSYIPFGTQTYTPSMAVPMNNYSFSLSIGIGQELKAYAPLIGMNGLFSIQSVRNKNIEKEAYGYMNTEFGTNTSMLDFNREKDRPYSENERSLPIPIATYDVFQVSGHGIGGAFRLFRNDNLNFREDENNSITKNYGLGFDFGLTDVVKTGINGNYVISESRTGNWTQNNHLLTTSKPVGQNQLHDSMLYEPVYFKQLGEFTQSNAKTHPGLMDYSLVRPNQLYSNILSSYTTQTGVSNYISNRDIVKLDPSPTKNIQRNRQPRNMVMQALTARQASQYGLNKQIRYYTIGNYTPDGGGLYPDKNIERESGFMKAHHISEVRVFSTDGSRYIYGIPVYNTLQTEITFAVGVGTGPAGNCATGLVSYSSNDITDKNDKGRDNFVQVVNTPAYAYSYLLTGIVSPDYVDISGDGITDDDYGHAVKFDYQKLGMTYRWRTPYSANQAMYQEGNKSDWSDDKGSIVYGEKEIYYLHSIVGKNHIAICYISQRFDGIDANGINGGEGYVSLQRLDSIVLYNKQDFYQNGLAAYRIKAVHFEYDYSLCGDVKNFFSSVSHPDKEKLTLTYKGKLTLKKIYFTYGSSSKGKLSPYSFSYNNENDEGFKYHIKAHDRWGVFKPVGSANCESTTDLTNSEFPYTIQNKTQSDVYAGVWSLNEIRLPSGGLIKVDYEADDYAFVQDKRSMTMYKIQGFGENNNFEGKDKFLYSNLTTTPKEYNYVFVDLNGTTTYEELTEIVRNIKTVQFTVFANINNGKYEYVKGYADLEEYGLTNGGQSAYIKLKKTGTKDNGGGRDVNPIALNIWNWTRIHASYLIYNQQVSQNFKENNFVKPFYELIGIYNDVMSMVTGIYSNLRLRGIGKEVNLNKSFLRLNAKNYRKIGGGHRVKRIVINDNWAFMGASNNTANDAEYGQEYTYTKLEELPNGQTIEISSGVTPFEPAQGSDENPFVLPRDVKHELKFVPDLKYMDDSPLGETFMPAPSVGYSNVTVKAIGHTDVIRTATGKQTYEFFTARDFPIKFTNTDVNNQIIRPNPIESFFNPFRTMITEVYASQGYKMEINDMHGKPRTEYTYSEHSDLPIAGVIYEYQTEDGNLSQLTNNVKVVKPDGTIINQEIGTEVDFWNDYRSGESMVTTASLDYDTDVFTIGIIPVLLPSLWPGYNKTIEIVNTAVSVKLVSRYGILKKTTAIKEGSRITTENLLYDGVTGNVLVSSVQNEFDRNTYSITTPAHWAYDEGMGPAYKNIGAKISNVTIELDTIKLPNGLNPRNYFVPGDEVLITNLNNKESTICHIYEGSDYKLNLIHSRNGNTFIPSGSSLYMIEVIRPARRNMANVPIQQITTMKNPVFGTSLTLDSVVTASVVAFKDYWPYYCDKYYETICDTTYNFPLDKIQSLYNELLSSYSVNEPGMKVDTKCILERLEKMGYKSESVDTLFYRTITEGLTTYTALTDTNQCIRCHDSLYIKLDWGEYIGFSYIDFSQCLVKYDYMHNCKDYYEDVLDIIPHNPLYESYRVFYDSILEPQCPTDTSFSVIFSATSSFSDSSNLKITFEKCPGDECDIVIDIPEKFCYKRAIQLVDLTYYSDAKFKAGLIVESFSGETDTIEVYGYATCGKLRTINCVTECKNNPNNDVVLNPYRSGILGNWRMDRNFAFVDQRNYMATPRTNDDGVFNNFTPYWQYNSTQKRMIPTTSNKWVWANRNTLYTPHGNPVETQDALGRHSSTLFGFNYTLPIGVAANAKYGQIAFESFEENSDFWVIANCFDKHFYFTGYSPYAYPKNDYAHSGKYSLFIAGGNSLQSVNQIKTSCHDPSSPFDETQMNWRDCNCVGRFSPDTGSYIISAWVKEGNNLLDTNFNQVKIEVLLHKSGPVTETLVFKPSGQIIDGWQRVYGSFSIGNTVEQVEIKLVAAPSTDCWFDDIRIHPFNSNMKTYAYDQITLRLMAELDENNFATYYEYDYEGALIRVKKETVKGIQTLKEVRKSIIKRVD